MIYPKPKSETEKEQLHRKAYELEKEDLTLFHKKMGWSKDTLNDFLVKSLKSEYEKELSHDGLI